MSQQPKFTAHHSAVLDASPAHVWQEVRDFAGFVHLVFGNAVKDVGWVGKSSAATVPAKIEFTLLPGNDLVTEEVVGRDELTRSLTYRTIGQALSLYDYVSTYRVLPVTNDHGRCFMEWSHEFKVVDNADPAFLPSFLDMVAGEMDTVQAYFAQ
ncbi:SRPBCC family protein [Saccharothrix sp. 6-C]|uniref:Polyketide cyclase/dehydrase/lipid transport protein n=1 Tax=Saccharothrix texasensis TaxID=103734 RepID=A0A3N1GY65_9PSEU|nr:MULTISPECIES: SRPBCC family protein [Saccharothrix]QQQ79716.1 SRPBCC family protein [Saccharothrix sp. 6-C]ROP35273.1 polyketide cyclase/dehydrase/lipid transport protein [Saccharothrix texasensis]